jgi:ankyrin repeat protein
LSSWRALKARVDEMRAATPVRFSDDIVGPFLRLVGTGELAAVEAALQATPSLVNAIGPHPFWGGRPQPLHVAIETNRFDMVQLLLRAGADVDGTNDEYSHWSPLMLAAVKPDRGRSKRVLLRRGAKIRVPEALLLGDNARMRRLLRGGRGALPELPPSDGSLLMLARTPAAIDRLLALGVSTDTRDRWGASPMEALSRMGRKGAPLVRHLASRGVAVDAEAFARLGDRNTLTRLVAGDPAIARRPTVVKAAVDFGHRNLVGWLIDRGADPDARSQARTSHDTCLHSAAWNGDLAMVELLLARGADRTLLDDDHQSTPEQWAEVSARVTNNPTCLEVAKRLRSP